MFGKLSSHQKALYTIRHKYRYREKLLALAVYLCY